MTNPTTTIREALDILYDFIELDGTTYAGPDPKTFREALAQLIQDLTTLRANSLDLSKIPDGYELNIWSAALVQTTGNRTRWFDGEGATAQSALDLAIERVMEESGG